jgi:tyrosinase
LNGAFDIYYFLGDKATMASADADPNNYATASTMAGFTHVFTAPREACDACAYTTAQSDEGQSTIVTSTNPITPMLRDYIVKGELEGLSPEQVIPFLQKHLYWRVVGINVVPQNPEAVGELQISVTSTVAVFRPDESIPAQWVGHEHPEVTERHVAGNPPDAA